MLCDTFSLKLVKVDDLHKIVKPACFWKDQK